MRILIILVVLALVAAMHRTTLASEDFRAKQSLNGVWQAVQVGGPADAAPETGWGDFTVPGVFHSMAEGGSRFAWLRKDISIPADWTGRRIFIALTGARYDPHIYVDGRLVGSRLEGYTPFEVEITEAVKPGATHRLEVCCQDLGATFVEGFELEPGGWDGRRIKGKLLAPVGGHHGFFGPWDDVWLAARPGVYLTDLVIVPSVRRGRLSVTGALSDRADGLRVGAEVLEDGRSVLTIPESDVSPDGSWKISSAFPDAHCWSPEDPHLYVLRVTLRKGRAGQALDVMEERFGFKEFWTEGPDFYLNGVKRHLLATSCWPPARPESKEFVRRAIQYWKDANCVAFRQHTQPWRKQWTEMADEMGMMMIIEGAMWTDSGRYAYEDERFWDNYRDHLARMVWRDRNNASVVMWSLENEFLSVGNDRYFPDLEQRLADLGPELKQLDPHHPITYESDLDPGGVADVIGLHYPHELPTHADYPNTCDWLAETVQTEAGGGLLGTREATFFWERKKPLYIGEYLWVPAQDHSPGTVFFGDDAYLGRVEFKRRAQALAWFDQTVAYRRAGVSGLCPWALGFPRGSNPQESVFFQAQKRAYEPVAAFLKEKDTRFFGGRTVTRTFDVFNDSPTEKHLELRWELRGTECRGSEKLVLPAAGYKAVEVRVELPQTWEREEHVFQSVLLADGREVHKERRTYRVEPGPRAIFSPAGVRIVLYDPEGKWGALMIEPTGRAGVLYISSLEKLAGADVTRDILLIAPGAWVPPAQDTDAPQVGHENADAVHLAGFLERGGRVLVLEQESLEGMPLPVSLVEHASTMTFPLDAGHPILDGIAAEDLKFWRGDNYVTRREVRRPTSHGARAVVVSGGNESLNQAPIVELQAGKGTVLLVQALVGAKLDAEPVARIILQNALNYLAAKRPVVEKTVVLSEDEDFKERLKQLGVAFDDVKGPVRADALARADLLILHGGGRTIAQSGPALRSFLNSEGPERTVYWHAPDPDAFAGLREVLGARDTRIEPSQGPVTIIRRDHEVLSGVSREDVCFTGPVRDWQRRADVDPSVVDRALLPDLPAGEVDRIEAGDMEIQGQIVHVSPESDLVTFATSGSGSTWIDVSEAGLYSLSVLAGGTPAAGVYPLVSVGVDDREVAAVSLSEEKITSYPVLAHLPAGRHKVSVAFVNDAVVGTEDRNLILDAILIGREPWRAEGVEFLTQPPAVAIFAAGRGRVVLDGVRWDINTGNIVKGHRYASALLANLGASFEAPEPEPTWLSPLIFEPVGRITYFGKNERELSLYSSGEVAAGFACVTPGRYSVFLRGRSTPAEGVYAKVEMAVDGRRIAEVEVRSGTDRVFRVGTVELSQGRHVLSARFTNDLQTASEDRNLWVSGIGFRKEP